MHKIVTAAAFLAAVLAGCGGGEVDPGPAPGPVRTATDDTVVTVDPSTITDDPSTTDEPSITDDPWTPEPATEDPPTTEARAPVEDRVVSGHAWDRDGNPMAGVMIQFYIVPRTFGGLYRAYTEADGSYAAEVPDGVYIVYAQLDNDDPNLVVDLEPQQTGPDGVASISVPPGHVVDFVAP